MKKLSKWKFGENSEKRQEQVSGSYSRALSTALRSTIWFFCDACDKLEVDMYYLARSGVDITETGWNLCLEKSMLIQSLKMFVVRSSQGDECLACINSR
jgi:hypothetical protein